MSLFAVNYKKLSDIDRDMHLRFNVEIRTCLEKRSQSPGLKCKSVWWLSLCPIFLAFQLVLIFPTIRLQKALRANNSIPNELFFQSSRASSGFSKYNTARNRGLNKYAASIEVFLLCQGNQNNFSFQHVHSCKCTVL